MKTGLLCLLLVFSPMLNADDEAELTETPVQINDDNGGAYLPYQDHRLSTMDRVFEATPIIGGRHEETKENYCLHAVERACVQHDVVVRLYLSNNRGANSEVAACKAWVRDCRELVSLREVAKQFGE